MLTISSKALGGPGQSQRAQLRERGLQRQSRAHLQADFILLDTPLMPQGSPATVFLHLEHAGCSWDSIAECRPARPIWSCAVLTLMSTTTRSFSRRSCRLVSTSMRSAEAAISRKTPIVKSVIGGRLSLTADLTSTATGYLSAQEPISKRGSAADFGFRSPSAHARDARARHGGPAGSRSGGGSPSATRGVSRPPLYWLVLLLTVASGSPDRLPPFRMLGLWTPSGRYLGYASESIASTELGGLLLTLGWGATRIRRPRMVGATPARWPL